MSTEEVNEYTVSAQRELRRRAQAAGRPVESVPGVEVLSARPLARHRQGPGRRRTACRTSVRPGRLPRQSTGSATCGWRPSQTSTSPTRTPTGRIRSRTWRSCTTASSPTTSSGGDAWSTRAIGSPPTCDSEIIAVYLAERMQEGMGLEDAMQHSLEDLDGVFTYICVTEDALGMAKDELAAKPLVLYEGDDMVALASEEMAIRAVIDHEIETYDPYESTGDGVDTVMDPMAGLEPRSTPRGLVELDATRSQGLGDRRRHGPRFDARELTTRQINLELRWLLYEQGDHRGHGPEPGRQALARRRAPHPLPDHASRAASATSRCGMIDGPEIQITGRVGWSSCREHDVRRRRHRMQRRLADRRGDPRRRPGRSRARSAPARASTRRAARSSSRGDAGSMTGFMMQRGRQIICGNVGPGPGRLDVRRRDLRRRQGQVAGRRLRRGRVDRRRHRAASSASSGSTASARRPTLQKFVCGKKLYNYDTLEPSERKLVL